MSIPNFDVREEYVGAGNVNQYTFSFKISDLSQLIVLVTDANFNLIFRVNGLDTINLSSVVYNANDGGGTVTLISNLASGYLLTLLLANDAPVQLSQFRDKSDFTLKRFEDALDYDVSALQRAAYLAQRSLKLGDNLPTEQSFDMTLPINTTNPNVQNNVGKVAVIGADNKSWILSPYINPPPSSVIFENQQAIADNQAAPAVVTGLTFDAASVIYTEVLYSIYRSTGAVERRETGKIGFEWLPLAGVWRIASRIISVDDALNIADSFSVSTVGTVGQLKYISDSFAVGKMRWKIINTIGVES